MSPSGERSWVVFIDRNGDIHDTSGDFGRGLLAAAAKASQRCYGGQPLLILQPVEPSSKKQMMMRILIRSRLLSAKRLVT